MGIVHLSDVSMISCFAIDFKPSSHFYMINTILPYKCLLICILHLISQQSNRYIIIHVL